MVEEREEDPSLAEQRDLIMMMCHKSLVAGEICKEMVEEREENPPIPEQREILIRKLSKSLVAGETWYIVDCRWMRNLKLYIGILKAPQLCCHPGPIDNTPILSHDQEKLRKGLSENIDYELVSEDCWDLLVEWYGHYDDQLPIRRMAINAGINYTMVEVYLVELKCYQSFDFLYHVEISVSKADLMGSVHNLIREMFNIKNHIKSRLWMTTVRSNNYDLINLGVTVQDTGLSSNQSIILETRQLDGSWERNTPSPSDHSMQESSNSHYFISCSQPSTSSQNFSSQLSNSMATPHYSYLNTTPGVCGLNNLGNTCFMNSVLQCMSNTPYITEYFLAMNHVSELNESNPLGMGGEIARAFGDLVRSIWSGRFNTTNPLNFKVQVAKFNPLFSGCQQHDAQELLTFLLDGLHEDLNRIKVKPYVPNKEYAGEEDRIFAEESWANHKLRNDSIVVDTFHGMLKSRVICPQCEHFSVAFDPFCSLSLPLHTSRDQQFMVKFIPFNVKKREVILKIYLPKMSLIKDLCHEVSLKTDTDPALLVVAELFNNHIHKFFSPDESLEIFDEKYFFYVFELNIPSGANLTDCLVLPMYFWEKCKPEDLFSFNHLFSMPLLLILPKKNVRKNFSMDKLTGKMSRHFFRNPETNSDTSTSSSDNEKTPKTTFRPKIYLFDISTDDNSDLIQIEFSENGNCMTDLKYLLDVDDPFDLFSRKVLIVKFTVEEKELYYSERSPSFGSDYHASKSTDNNNVNLNDCFELFTTYEKLGVDNAWYCPGCKVHQRATKKFDLWKLPKMLVIQLKRFSYIKNGDKIDYFVDFPLKNLRLSKYIINPSEQEMSYDLVGVINHFGTMTAGHYTAFCKNKDDRLWYNFDDDFTHLVNERGVLSSAAYVLFYKRNDFDNQNGAVSESY